MSIPVIVTINVFPESGHHYTFVPIEKAIIEKHPYIRKLCNSERSEWREVNHPWLRARFASKDGQPGIWVVVESNLGSVKRGSIYEPRRPITDAEASQYDQSNPSPYAAFDDTLLPSEREIDIRIPSPEDQKTMIDIARLMVIWKRPAGHPIEVDLIVDFGNTRTAVLALEKVTSQDGKLSSVCRSIRFQRDGYDYEMPSGGKSDDTSTIVDSWFILHEPPFFSLEPGSDKFRPNMEIETTEEKVTGLFTNKVEKRHFCTARVPQMFAELSPVVFGDSARQILGDLSIAAGGNYTLSSPKRYVWDTDPVGRDALPWWTMKLNRWNPKESGRAQLPLLAGSMLRFLPVDGRDWSLDTPPNEATDRTQSPHANPHEPSYPRSEAMTWAALAIIELAYRQITSEEWRKGNQEFVPRKLRNVLVTFPSGWSHQETSAYRAKWQKAINIFTLAHLRERRSVLDGGDRPELLMDLDEAVASQIPFIYSEIRRLGNIGENWIELFGRGSAAQAYVRVMTVDIGGGTTDISVVEYRDAHKGHGVDLQAKLLFRDSSSVAGDTLTREIIERILLPSIGAAIAHDQDQAVIFENLLSAPHQLASEKAKWSRIVKLVMLPIIRQWLRDLTYGLYGCPETGDSWSPDRIIGSQGPLVDEQALRELNEIFTTAGLPELMGYSTPIPYAEDQLRQCIEDVFRPMVQSLAKYVAAYEVHVVTLSGKPSELPQVKTLLEDFLPIMPHRIIQAKNYPAGDWYPMTSDNRINDAKSVTAVGAALYQAIKNGQIDGWRITSSANDAGFLNYWGSMPPPNKPTHFGQILLNPKEEESTNRVHIGMRIGRKLLPSAAKPEQMYRIRWRHPAKWEGEGLNAFFNVTLRRELPESVNDIEGLKLVRADGEVCGVSITADDLELQLCTLEGEEFWGDVGRFDVSWQDQSSSSW
ncbi:MAG: virulence factor SrfB [Verrucomicrobiota bacterium]